MTNLPGYDAWKLASPEDERDGPCPFCGAYSPRSCELEEETGGCPWEESQPTAGLYPAFPDPALGDTNFSPDHDRSGLTARQYAAIALKVPDSGADWLDAMIRRRVAEEWSAQNEIASRLVVDIVEQLAKALTEKDPQP